MMKPIEIYNRFDIVIVPFPFIDIQASKNRPALIISSNAHFTGEASVMAMITSALHTPWPLDLQIKDLEETGLSAPSIVRMKLFTLDHRVIIRKAGQLGKKDQLNLSKSLKLLLN